LFYSKKISQEFRSIFVRIYSIKISTKEKKSLGIHRRERKEKEDRTFERKSFEFLKINYNY